MRYIGAMYDDIADHYHLVYDDWPEAIKRQAAALDGVMRTALGAGPHRVLDVSCGIGTQALGLASLGHAVTATDLSAGAIRRARREAEQRKLDIHFGVADMRRCGTMHDEPFDVVLSADNSVPHLPDASAVSETLRGMYDCLTTGGLALVGIRDYRADENRASPQLVTYGFREDAGHRYVVFQTRDWSGNAYRVAMIFVREASEHTPASVVTGHSTYHAIEVQTVMQLCEDVGFRDVRRLDDVMHQPVIAARR